MTWASTARRSRTPDTFHGNADQGALLRGASGLPTLADDSGLEVDALGGGPGVLTRRYAGPDATDADNNAKLLQSSRDCPRSSAAPATSACWRTSTPRTR